MKIFTQIKTLALVAGMMMTCNAMAGDGTKANPYTVAELNAQKEALAASGEAVWVKASLTGLGVAGTRQENESSTSDKDQMAGVFGDGNDTFVAYSYQILGGLAMSDLTNTENLLVKLTYGTQSHPYGNTASPQYVSNYEPTDAHFSLEEVHGALSLKINNGFRGYHIASCYVLPKGIVAARVTSGYTAAKGATITYGYYDGAKSYVINKNTALVLLAYDDTYDFVLSAGLYEQINSNGLIGGTQAGLNVGTGNSNKDRWRFRFVSDGTKTGFERNSDDNATVNLESKDEIFLQVNSKTEHFAGHWDWETEDKKWISWQGSSYADFRTIFDFQHNNMDLPVGQAGTDESLHAGDLAGVEKTMGDVTISFTAGNNPGSRYFYNGSKGYHFNPSKNSTFTLKAAEGKAVKGIYIVFQSGKKDLAVSNGTYDNGTWTGNAEAVTFTPSAAKSIWAINVLVGDADEETITEVKEVKAEEGAAKVAKTPAAQGIYDLGGHKVNLMQKGNVYIIDGKKYFK